VPARVTGIVNNPVPELQVKVSNDRGTRVNQDRSMRYFAGFGAGISFGVHANCLNNLVRGITERVLRVNGDEGLKKPPQPKVDVFKRLDSVRSRLLHKSPPTPVVSLDEFPLLYNGRKRGVYERAVESLKSGAVAVSDSYVSTFIKAEKVNFSAKVDPAPRVIQPRSPRYNVEVGRFLKLFEKSLVEGFRRCFGYSVICKGMNADQVGMTLFDNWSHFHNPVAVGLDASRFDQHVSYDALKWEHSVYNSVFRDSKLAKLLEMQLYNTGIGRVGDHVVRYKVRGCRMSGDMNTGMGNCLIMSSIVIAYCEDKGIEYRLSNNGDDCVVFLEQENLPKLNGLDEWFLDFGFKLTREEPCYMLEAVSFCQFHPIKVGDGWRCVRDPKVSMSKDCVSLVGWNNEYEFRSWAHAVASCGISLTSGVPVCESWYRALGRIGKCENRGVDDRVNECGAYHWARGVKRSKITEESRASFYYAFGIMPDEQLALEDHYDSITDAEQITPLILTESDTSRDNINPITYYNDQ